LIFISELKAPEIKLWGFFVEFIQLFDYSSSDNGFRKFAGLQIYKSQEINMKNSISPIKLIAQFFRYALIPIGLFINVESHATPFSPSMEIINIPRAPDNPGWTCPFAKPNGAYDWYNFSTHAPIAPAQPYYDYILRWDNGRPEGSGWYGVPTRDIDHYGMGNKAVLQALYLAMLNRKTPSGAVVSPFGGGLYPYLESALKSPVKMGDLIGYVRKNTGITDGSEGTPAQLAKGLQASIGFYLSCNNNSLGISSNQIYQSSSWMPYMDIAHFTGLLYDGTVMILQTNKLTLDQDIGGWVRASKHETYIVKSVRKSNIGGANNLITYTLYNVADGKTKIVTMRNGKMRYLLSSGNLSKNRNMTLVDDTNTAYLEVIIGYAGIDPLINRY